MNSSTSTGNGNSGQAVKQEVDRDGDVIMTDAPPPDVDEEGDFYEFDDYDEEDAVDKKNPNQDSSKNTNATRRDLPSESSSIPVEMKKMLPVGATTFNGRSIMPLKRKSRLLGLEERASD